AGGIEKLNAAGVQLIWQTGRGYFEKAKAFASASVKVYDFIREMDLAYASADAVISRAGALSVSELCLVGKPVIFVPSPNVTADQQTKNAMTLVDKNAALIVRDIEAQEKLVSNALLLMQDEVKCRTLSQNISALAKKDSAQKIAEIIYDLVEKR